ncbi:MAG: peptidylprolyl isomerase [bacterium]|nr:peptidylprolyl isomerase [bacterium]
MKRVSFLLFLGVLTFWGLSCAKQSSDPVILMFNNKPVHKAELDVLAQLALGKIGLSLTSEEGQQRYRQIAPNLYETLITTYTLKSAAEVQGYMPTPEELEQEFQAFKAKTTEQQSYDTLMGFFKISEEQLKDTLKYHIAMQKLQTAKLQSFEAEEPTEKQIEDFFYKNNALFRYPKRMRCSQIFLTLPADADEEARRQVQQRLENIQTMLGDSPAKTFPGLAMKYSEDTATAKRGGDLGFIDRDGPWSAAFLQSAFALQVGQVSGLVETPMGFHLLWATDHDQTLDEAHDDIKQMLVKQSMAAQFAQWIEEEKGKMDIVRLFDPVQFEILPQE